jgi:hypothetical protein
VIRLYELDKINDIDDGYVEKTRIWDVLEDLYILHIVVENQKCIAQLIISIKDLYIYVI